jgi:hypothetical protein
MTFYEKVKMTKKKLQSLNPLSSLVHLIMISPKDLNKSSNILF